MSELALMLVLSLAAGAAIPLGAVFAHFDTHHPAWLKSEWRHLVIAFGGGALLAAVALVLVPDGVEVLSPTAVALCFLAGGIVFCLLDIRLRRARTPAGQLVAMVSDFVPEAIALGASFAIGESTGVLIALLILLQNLPEGFSAYEELSVESRLPERRTLRAFALLALLGPAASLTGYFWLSRHPEVIAMLMVFAAGGILYLIFEDVAPQASLENSWIPPLGAVAGFLLGLVGSMLI